MDLNKISNFIKTKRKELGITQDELANKLFVTEKAISRWETGRGTPDISLLLPLSKELKVDVSEILNGEEIKKNKNDVEQLIKYNEITKENKYNIQFKITIIFYILSILTFLLYLRFDYDPNIEVNYLIRFIFTLISSLFIIIGNKIYINNYVEKIEDKKKIIKLSQIIIFIYYIILLFNMGMFARYNSIDSYNIIPFKLIIDSFKSGSAYSIIIIVFGNLFVLVPLEYFIIELFKIKKLSVNLILSIGISFLIDLIQYVFKIGVFDVDDIILRIFGMILFYIIYTKTKKDD